MVRGLIASFLATRETFGLPSRIASATLRIEATTLSSEHTAQIVQVPA
jgi:hypothetical protein